MRITVLVSITRITNAIAFAPLTSGIPVKSGSYKCNERGYRQTQFPITVSYVPYRIIEGQSKGVNRGD